jgi:hypothetical protein
MFTHWDNILSELRAQGERKYRDELHFGLEHKLHKNPFRLCLTCQKASLLYKKWRARVLLRFPA